MSLTDATIIRRNSQQLILIIHKREVNTEISEEIKALVAAGVNVNLKDLYEENNTVLHHAVARNDLKCVEFLLTLKPDLNIVNDYNETAKSLARKLKFYDIFSLLNLFLAEEGESSNLYSKAIYPRYIGQCQNSVKNFEINLELKVLRLLISPGSSNARNSEFSLLDFRKLLEKSSNLFVISIEGDVNFTVDDLQAQFSSISRPLVFQLTKTDKTVKIYYKNDKPGIFKQIQKSQVSTKSFQTKLQSKNECELQLVLNGLWSKMANNDGNLLNICVDMDDITLISKCAAKSNVLSLRFLQLFLTTKECLGEVVHDAIEYGGIEMLLAALDLPFQDEGAEKENEEKMCFNLLDHQQKVLHCYDAFNKNHLVMEAMKHDNIEALKLLLQHIDVSSNQEYANTAWNNKSFDQLYLLLLNDSPFPFSFNMDKIEQENFFEITGLLSTHRSIFKAISEGQIEEVKKYFNKNQQMKVLYDEGNETALTVAWKSEQIEVFKFLTLRGCHPGINTFDVDKAWQQLSREDKIDLRNFKQMNFGTFNEHFIHHLVAKSKLGSKVQDPDYCYCKIRKFYRRISDCEYGKLLLEFLSMIDNLDIFFDFKRDHIGYMDPTVGGEEDGLTLGKVLNKKGRIYIAAGNSDANEIMGVMCHEFLHFILETIFENNAYPFSKQDEGRKEKLREITANIYECFESKDVELDEIIFSVFTCYFKKGKTIENFLGTIWLREIVVRPIQLEIFYMDDQTKLSKIKNIGSVKALFNFFESTILTEIKKQAKTIRNELAVKKVNRLGELVSKIKNVNVEVEKEKKDEIDIKAGECNIFWSNVPLLTLKCIHQIIGGDSNNLLDTVGIFVTHNSILNEEILSEVEKARNLNHEKFIVVDCSEAEFMTEICNIMRKKLENLSSVVFIGSLKNECEMNNRNLKCKRILHGWEDLNDDCKTFIMDKQFEFQGKLVKYKDVLEEKILKEFDLNQVLFNTIEVGKSIEFNQYYFERFFLKSERVLMPNKNSEYDEKNNNSGNSNIITSNKNKTSSSDLIAHAEEKKIVIISDTAGIGKTMALRNLALKFKIKSANKWVEFVDLKKNIQKFKKFSETPNNAQGSKADFFEFFCVTMKEFTSATDCKNDTEKKIMEHLYLRGKIVFLFDGFDEISPYCKEIILKYFKKIDETLGNIVVITTRTHLQNDLENLFKQVSFTLSPFTEEDQIKFLNNYGIDEDSVKDLIENISMLETNGKSVFGIPLLLKMVAEVHKKDKSLSSVSNLFEFFKSYYVQKMNEVYSNEKQEIFIQDMAENIKEGIIKPSPKIHQIALDYFFTSESKTYGEDILRYGIVQIVNRTPKFSHETVAEFLVADFFFECIKTSNLNEKNSVLLFKILSDKKFMVVRSFLELALESQNNLEEIFANAYAKLDGTIELFSVFTNLVQENKGILLATIMKRHGSKSIFENIAGKKFKKLNEHFGYHFMDFVACKSNPMIIRTLSKYVNVKKIPLREDKRNIFHFALKNRSEGVFTEIIKLFDGDIECIKTMLKQKDQRNMTIIEHLNPSIHSRSVVEFFDALSKIFNNNELKEILTETSYPFFLRLTSYKWVYPECIESAWKFIRKVLNQEELKLFVKKTDHFGNNALHLSAIYSTSEVFVKTADMIKSTLDQDEIVQIINGTRNDLRNILHCLICEHQFEEGIKVVFEKIKEFVGIEGITHLMKQKEITGLNSVQFLLDRNGSNNCAYGFLKLFTDVLTPSELKKLLYTDLQNYSNYFFDAIASKDSRAIRGLWLLVSKALNSDEISQFIRQFHHNRKNVVQLAARYNTPEVLMTVFNIIEAANRSDFYSILKENDFEGSNVIHNAVMNKNNQDIVAMVLNKLEEKINPNDLKLMLCQKNKRDKNPFSLMFSSMTLSVKSVDKFLKTLKALFDENELRNFLTEEMNNHFPNFFILTLKSDNPKCVKVLWKFLKEILKNSELRKLVLQTDILQHVLHIAAQSKTSEMFSEVKEILKNSFNDEEIRNISNCTDLQGNNFIHVSAVNKNYKFDLKTVLVEVKELVGKDQLLILFNKTNKDGYPPLHICLFNKQNEEKKIEFVEALSTIFTSNDLKCLLRAIKYKNYPKYSTPYERGENNSKKKSEDFELKYKNKFKKEALRLGGVHEKWKINALNHTSSRISRRAVSFKVLLSSRHDI